MRLPVRSNSGANFSSLYLVVTKRDVGAILTQGVGIECEELPDRRLDASRRREVALALLQKRRE